MTPEQWLSVSLLVLVAATLASLTYAVTAGHRDEDAGAGPVAANVPGPDPDGDGTVTCSDCGAHNERGYRYCRNCAAELPGVWIGGEDASRLDSRSVE